MQLKSETNFVKIFGKKYKPQPQTISESVKIVRLKRFVKRRRSGSSEDDNLRTCQQSKEMSKLDTSADSNKAVS